MGVSPEQEVVYSNRSPYGTPAPREAVTGPTGINLFVEELTNGGVKEPPKGFRAGVAYVGLLWEGLKISTPDGNEKSIWLGDKLHFERADSYDAGKPLVFVAKENPQIAVICEQGKFARAEQLALSEG